MSSFNIMYVSHWVVQCFRVHGDHCRAHKIHSLVYVYISINLYSNFKPTPVTLVLIPQSKFRLISQVISSSEVSWSVICTNFYFPMSVTCLPNEPPLIYHLLKFHKPNSISIQHHAVYSAMLRVNFFPTRKVRIVFSCSG